MPALLYHYTSAPPHCFAVCLWREAAATHDPTLTADEAIAFLGVTTRPNKILVVESDNFVPNAPFIVQPHKNGPGGGTDFRSRLPILRDAILQVIAIPGEPP